MLENKIIRGGVLQGDSDELYCKGFDFLHPCGISNKVLQISCDGRYEIRDQNDNTALVVSLDMNRKCFFYEVSGDCVFKCSPLTNSSLLCFLV